MTALTTGTQAKDELIEFLVQIQKKVLQMDKQLHESESERRKVQRDNLVFLIEILDHFENLLSRIESKKDLFDTNSLRMFNSFDIIKNKIIRRLESQGVHPIDFSDNLADAGQCEVVDTVESSDEGLRGKIIKVLNKGYMQSGQVVREARVVTYR